MTEPKIKSQQSLMTPDVQALIAYAEHKRACAVRQPVKLCPHCIEKCAVMIDKASSSCPRCGWRVVKPSCTCGLDSLVEKLKSTLAASPAGGQETKTEKDPETRVDVRT